MLKEIYGQEQLTRARAAARGGRFQLLMGAGVMVGSANARGATPLGRETVGLLKKKFPQAPIEDEDNLSRAYQRALISSNELAMWNFMKELFARTRPAKWLPTLANQPWKRAWTLNVDDGFENAFLRSDARKYQDLSTVSWDDPYLESPEFQVIHLHGHIISDEPRKLVFSFTEYQRLAEKKPVWHQVLDGLIRAEPFVIIGARLLDDPDMERLLMSGSASSSGLSLVVDPFISNGNRWELEQLGFKVVKTAAEEFLDDWIAEVSIGDAELEILRRDSAITLPQFRDLKQDDPKVVVGGHDVYSGDAPIWADATGERLANFSWIQRLQHEKLRPGFGGGKASLIVIYADRLSGGTAALLESLHFSTLQDVPVMLFDRSSRWSVELLMRAAESRGAMVIGIDGAADFADDIDASLRSAEERGIGLTVVAVETRRKALALEERLAGSYEIRSVEAPDRLSRVDASLLVRKLERFGRLGSLELKSGKDRIEHFRGKDIFSGMLDSSMPSVLGGALKTWFAMCLGGGVAISCCCWGLRPLTISRSEWLRQHWLLGSVQRLF